MIQCEGLPKKHTADLLVQPFNFEEGGRLSQGLLLIVNTDHYRKWLECITNFDEFKRIPKVCTFLPYTMIMMRHSS